jgi:hypothetical protein
LLGGWSEFWVLTQGFFEALGNHKLALVIVGMVAMHSVFVAVVQVVDMILMLHAFVAAFLAVNVRMVSMGFTFHFMIVHMPLV